MQYILLKVKCFKHLKHSLSEFNKEVSIKILCNLKNTKKDISKKKTGRKIRTLQFILEKIRVIHFSLTGKNIFFKILWIVLRTFSNIVLFRLIL